MTTITPQIFKSLNKQLQSALNLNKKGVYAIRDNNFQVAKFVSDNIKMQFSPSIPKDMCMICAATLLDTKINGKGERSTAMFPAYDNLWTVGSFGSVFIDIKIADDKIRVHFLTPENAEKAGFAKKPTFYFEKHN